MFAPAIAILVLLVDPGILRRPRDIVKNIFWLVLPLAFYLYLPLFGNNSPWYSNTWQGFLAQVSGGEAGDFLRLTPPQILDGITVVSRYLFDSFGYLGGILILIGVLFAFINRKHLHRTQVQVSQFENRKLLFLSLSTLTYSIWGTLYAGEPDRYLVLPFAFLIYWFAMGAGAVEHVIDHVIARSGATKQSPPELQITLLQSVRLVMVTMLALLIILPFSDRFRIADWSTFDRVYKQWDEIFTLPIPNGAALAGNWGQLNAMRYMQRVENRRPDLQFVGTLYDPEPQTQAAQNILPEGGTLFLAPGIPQPNGNYRYAQLGPLLEVREQRQMNAPAVQKNIAINSSLTLANYEITTALEPYAPTKSIAPTRTVRVALTWRANDVLKDFIVRVNLYDLDGRLIARKDEAPVRGLYSATQWQRGEYVSDVHNLQIPGGTPPGTYTLKMQTLDTQTKSATSDEILLTSIIVERATNLTRADVFIAHPVDIGISPRFRLWGYGGTDASFHAGDKITLSLLWYASDNSATAWMPNFFRLYIWNGAQGLTWTLYDLIPFYPRNEWQKGEVLKAYYDLQLPDNLSPGEYRLNFHYLDSSDQFTISEIQIVP
jgi:hypothetical protein